MVNFGYPYNDIVICKDSTDYLVDNYCVFISSHFVEFEVVDLFNDL